MTGRLTIAGAGSGKTRHIVRDACANSGGSVLVTTFTRANEAEIRRRFVSESGCIPSHVTVQTWFSFLLQHGARPYQGSAYRSEITGLVLAEGESAKFVPESNVRQHYFTDHGEIYSDKLAKFAIKCNGAVDGAVVDRLSRIFSRIYVDEVQDIAGYDLDFLRLLLNASISLTLVGDPRQATYFTSNARRNRHVRGSRMMAFFDDRTMSLVRDDNSLLVNHRSAQEICDLANRLYPSFVATRGGQTIRTGHDGVFLIGREDLGKYMKQYSPVQLTWDSHTKGTIEGYQRINFGMSKGMEFDRTVIFPTKSVVDWLRDHGSSLENTTRAKLYVALTRARFSVGIVTDDNRIGGIPRYLAGGVAVTRSS